MAQKLKIQLRGNPNQGRQSFVVPGHVNAKKREKLTWESPHTDATLFFPDRKLFGTRVIEISKGGQRELTLDNNLEVGEEYIYAIYCSETGDFAEGGSFPVIIIRE